MLELLQKPYLYSRGKKKQFIIHNMSLKGPIICIEDDIDDQLLIGEIIENLNIPNKLIFFPNGVEALQYFETTQEQPFLILCDINMPRMNGFELRNRITQSETLRRKTIPFVFLTTAASSQYLKLAYDTMVQGFYKKGNTYDELQEQLTCIVDYWKHSLHPNSKV